MNVFLWVQILLWSCLFVTDLQAQEQYRILFLNRPPVEIGGRECRVNDCFEAEETIRWKDDRQVMKVISLRTQLQSVVAARGFQTDKPQTLASYISQRKRLSTRDGSPMLLPQLRDYLTDTFYLIDSIEVKTLLPVDDGHFFYADYYYGGELIHKRLPAVEQGFRIDRSLFTIDGTPVPPFETDLSVYYLDEEKGEAVPVTTGLHLVPVW